MPAAGEADGPTGVSGFPDRAEFRSRARLVELLGEHDVRPRRSLGQNFVIDPNTLRRIARLAGVGEGDKVVEVGAGLGALTLELAATGASVTAIEVDSRLLAPLAATVEPVGVVVVHADATTVDWEQLLGSPCATGTGGDDGSGLGATVLVGNLPYNVATPIVLRALDEAQAIERILVMVQREVGERLVAGVGDPAYGAVSVKVTYHATATIVGAVPRNVFHPRPNVDSVLVSMVRRPSVAVDPELVDPHRLFTVVRAGFAKRRKMLRGALASIVDADAFADAGIDPRARVENLDVEAWGRLAAAAAGRSSQRQVGADADVDPDADARGPKTGGSV